MPIPGQGLVNRRLSWLTSIQDRVRCHGIPLKNRRVASL